MIQSISIWKTGRNEKNKKFLSTTNDEPHPTALERQISAGKFGLRCFLDNLVKHAYVHRS